MTTGTVPADYSAVIGSGSYTQNANAAFINCTSINVNKCKGTCNMYFFDCGTSSSLASVAISNYDSAATWNTYFYSGYYNYTFDKSVHVYGGTFSKDPTSYLQNNATENGLEVDTSVSDRYTVRDKKPAEYKLHSASDASVKYETLQQAVAAVAVNGSETFVLDGGLEISGTVTIPEGKHITIDLGGFNISGGTIENSGVLRLEDNSNQEVKGLFTTPVVNKKGSIDITYGQYGSTFTLEGGTLTTHGGVFTSTFAYEEKGCTANLRGGTYNCTITVAEGHELVGNVLSETSRGVVICDNPLSAADISYTVRGLDPVDRGLGISDFDLYSNYKHLKTGWTTRSDFAGREALWDRLAELRSTVEPVESKAIEATMAFDRFVKAGSVSGVASLAGQTRSLALEDDVDANDDYHVFIPMVTGAGYYAISYKNMFNGEENDRWAKLQCGLKNNSSDNIGTVLTFKYQLRTQERAPGYTPQNPVYIETFTTYGIGRYMLGGKKAAIDRGTSRMTYDSLAAAVADVKDGERILVGADTAEDVTLAKAGTYTIDPYGFNFTGTVKVADGYTMNTSTAPSAADAQGVQSALATTYVVVDASVVEGAGGTKYPSVAAAIAGEMGNEIALTVTANVTETVAVPAGKKVTITVAEGVESKLTVNPGEGAFLVETKAGATTTYESKRITETPVEPTDGVIAKEVSGGNTNDVTDTTELVTRLMGNAALERVDNTTVGALDKVDVTPTMIIDVKSGDQNVIEAATFDVVPKAKEGQSLGETMIKFRLPVEAATDKASAKVSHEGAFFGVVPVSSETVGETVCKFVEVTSNAFSPYGYELLGGAADPVAVIGDTGYATLAEAVAAVQDGQTIVLLKSCVAKGPSYANKGTVTFTAANEDVVLDISDMTGPVGAAGTSLVFKDMKLNGFRKGASFYNGWQSAGEYYEGCTIDGCTTLYSPNVTFKDCTFNNEENEYSLYDYAAGKLVLDGCTFNCAGKAIKVYNEGARTFDVFATNTTFNASEVRKAAFQLDVGSGMNANIVVDQSCSLAGTGYTTGVEGGDPWIYSENEPETSTPETARGQFALGTNIVRDENGKITGGTFTRISAGLIAKGFEAIDNGDGTFNVGEIAVAKIGETTYPSVAGAIRVAAGLDAGATVEILRDSSEAPLVPVAKMKSDVTLVPAEGVTDVSVALAPTANSADAPDTDGMAYIVSVDNTKLRKFTIGEGVTLNLPPSAPKHGACYIGYSSATPAELVINGRLEAYQSYVGSLSRLTVNPSGSIKSISENMIVRWGAAVDITGTGADWSAETPQGDFSYVEQQGGVVTLTDTFVDGGSWWNITDRNGKYADYPVTLTLDGSVLTVSGAFKLAANTSVEMDAASQIIASSVVNNGSINIDATGIAAPVKVIDYTGSAEMTLENYGTVTVAGDETYEAYVEDDDLWVQPVVAISTAEELVAFAEAVNGGDTFAGKKVVLTADIDMTDVAFTPIGNVTAYPSITFKGTFDGRDHKISNLKASDFTPNYATAGLFGSLGKGAVVQNLTLVDPEIESSHYAGAIVGYISEGPVNVINCSVEGGSVTSTPELIGGEYDNGDKVGGILGYGAGTGNEITDCSISDMTITAYRDIGGIAGCANASLNGNSVSETTIVQDNTYAYKGETITTVSEICGRDTGAPVPTVENETSEVEIVRFNPVAKVGGVGYETLQAALDAAQAGGTVTLLKDIEGVTGTFEITKAITLDGNGHKIVAAVNENPRNMITAYLGARVMFQVRAADGVTFKNLTVDGGTTHYYTFLAETKGGVFTVENTQWLHGGEASVGGTAGVGYGAAIHVNGGNLLVDGAFHACTGGKTAGVFPFTGILYDDGGIHFNDGVTATIGDDLLLVGMTGALDVSTEEGKAYVESLLAAMNVPAGFAPYTLKLSDDSSLAFTGASPLSWNDIIDYGKQIMDVAAEAMGYEELDKNTTPVEVGLLADTELTEAFAFEDSNLTVNGNGNALSGTITYTDEAGQIANVELGTEEKPLVLDMTEVTKPVQLGDAIVVNDLVIKMTPEQATAGTPVVTWPTDEGVEAPANEEGVKVQLFDPETKEPVVTEDPVELIWDNEMGLAYIGPVEARLTGPDREQPLYTSLAEAIAQAENGETVTLMMNIENFTGTVEIEKSLTFDGAGHKIAAKPVTTHRDIFNAYVRSSSMLKLKTGAVTLKNITLDGDASHAYTYLVSADNGGVSLTTENVNLLNGGELMGDETGAVKAAGAGYGAAVHLNNGATMVVKDGFTACTGGTTDGVFPFTGILVDSNGANVKFDLTDDSDTNPTVGIGSDLLLVGMPEAIDAETAQDILDAMKVPTRFIPYTLTLDDGSAYAFTGASPLGWNDIIEYGKEIMDASAAMGYEGLDKETTPVEVGLLTDTVLPDTFTFEDSNFTVNGNGNALSGTIEYTDNAGLIENIELGAENPLVIDLTGTTKPVQMGEDITVTDLVIKMTPEQAKSGKTVIVWPEDADEPENPENVTVKLVDPATAEPTGDTKSLIWDEELCIAYIGPVEARLTGANHEPLYTTLAEAMAQAESGDTVKMLSDVALTNAIDVTTAVTLDLNGKAITAATGWKSDDPGNKDAMFAVVRGASLTVDDTTTDKLGKIDCSTSGADKPYAAIKLTKTGEPANGDVAAVTVDGGSVIGNYYGICGNGSRHDTAVTVNGGLVKGTIENDCTGIFNPQNGALTVTGGTVEGSTAIYVKSGTIKISGGTITATGAAADYVYSGSGLNSTGDALVIDNCGNPGGTPIVSVTGGAFSSANNKVIGSYGYGESAPLEKFVSGGIYNKPVDQACIVEGKFSVDNTDEATKAAYPYAVGIEEPFAPLKVTFRDAVGEKPAEKVPFIVSEDWVAENFHDFVGTAEELKQAIEATLDETKANGLRGWQNYQLGLDGSETVNPLSPDATAADNQVNVIVKSFRTVTFPKHETGVVAQFVLMQGTPTRDAAGEITGWIWADVQTQGTSKFSVPLTSLEVETYWRIKAVFSQATAK